MKLNLATAQQIAERETHRRIAASPIFSRYQFSPPTMQSETDRFWVFVSSSEALFEEGVTPDAIYICVDKMDGHLWSRIEQETFYTQPSLSQPQALPLSRVA